jgi:carboxyl-terminal processing protease
VKPDRRQRACALLAVVILATLWTTMGRTHSQPSAKKPAAFRKQEQEILQIVGQEFYDSKRAAQWVQKHRNYAAGVTHQAAFAERTNRALADLHTSHTGYYTARDTAYYALRSIFQHVLRIEQPRYESIGADFARLPQGTFARQIFAGSPAEKAGLLRGDQVLSADGKPFHPVQAFQGKAGRSVNLKILRQRGASPLSIRAVPKRVQPKQEWLAAQWAGSRLITRNGKRIAIVPLFSGAGDEYRQAVQDAIAARFQNADALVLDFRNGYGGLSPDFMNLFNPLVPTLTSTDKKGQRRSFTTQWRKPLYVLINNGSRSGKEIIAYTIQLRRVGTLIGERTAGAVVGGRAFLLSDRSLLYLAVQDVRVEGKRLEGVGVTPDITVPDNLPYAMGADPQLEKALTLAAQK